MSFARKSGHFTIVRLANAAVCALRVKAAAVGVQYVGQSVKRGPWESSDGLVAALKTVARELECAADPVFLVLARHEVTSRIMEFPSHDDDELAGMVRFGAGDLVPYPVEELVTAHHVIERKADGTSRTLVAVVHNDTLHQHIDWARQAGLKPERVLWSTACLVTAVQVADPTRDDVRALLDLGPGGFEVLVMNGTQPEYTRGLATEVPWQSEPTEGMLAELSAELRNALAAHRRESLDGVGASEVYISSDVVEVAPVASALAQEVDYLCEPAAFANEKISGDAALGGIPLVSWGAALTVQGAKSCAIDLTPRKELEKRAMAGIKTKAIRVAVAVAILLAALAAVYAQAVVQRNAYIVKLEEQADGLRPRVRDAVIKRRHLERLQQQVERKDTVLELMSALVDVAPREGLNLTNFRYRREGGIELYGRAKTLKHIESMAEALRGIGRSSVPQFARASIGYQNLGRERQEEVWDFHIPIPFADESGETEAAP